MVQPEVANILLQDRLLANQGLLSRLLVTAPKSASGIRQPRPEKPETADILRAYGKRLLGILEKPLPLAPGKANELAPRPLPLSADAAKTWEEFVGHVEGQMGPGGSLEPIKGLANKLPEHAARLAAVRTLVGDIISMEIDDEDMKGGIALAEHYAAEALRIFEVSKVSVDLLLAQRLLDWMHQHWSEKAISLPDIYQRSLNAIRDKATAAKLVRILVDHGWLLAIPGGATVAGHPRREAWWIVKEN